jgi:hypothetical protein
MALANQFCRVRAQNLPYKEGEAFREPRGVFKSTKRPQKSSFHQVQMHKPIVKPKVQHKIKKTRHDSES